MTPTPTLTTVSLLAAALAAAASGSVTHALSARPVPVSTLTQAPDGRLLYLKNCRTCHGATGTPSAENREKYPKIRTLNDSAFLARISDDSLRTVLMKGKGTDMKSWSDNLTRAEMDAVIRYVRTLPGKKR